MKLFSRIRRVYLFGYGADREPELIRAVTGRKPWVVGTALLEGYELRVQRLDEVTGRGGSAQKILRRVWGDGFISYAIVPRDGGVVRGTLYKLSLHDRHLIDAWEMVDLGWYNKAFVEVSLGSGKVYGAETQVLGPNQEASQAVDGLDYSSWLLPKDHMLRAAARIKATI
jgi:hypothetical protein